MRSKNSSGNCAGEPDKGEPYSPLMAPDINTDPTLIRAKQGFLT